jgi:hypothetical protein
MTGKRIGGRAYLVKKLRERGLSRRHAVRILNAVIKEMKRALKRGDYVELPIGFLMRVERHYSKYWDSVHDRPAGSQQYTVELVLDYDGERLLDGPEPGKKPG